MGIKKILFLFSLFTSIAGGILAQPLLSGFGSEREALVAKIDSNTIYWHNKLFPVTDAGELNIYGFDATDIPVYSDSTYALRLSLLETEIPLEYNQQVRAYIDLYANRKRNLVSKVLSASRYYFPIFEEVFDRENVPMEFKYLAVIESALNQKAISPMGAAGLWQFMAPTGKMYGLRTDSYIDDRKDVVKSTEAAVKYFKNSYRIYGDWLLVIASYNCGPGNVTKAIKRAGGGTRTIWELMPYLPKETRGYVPAFIAAAYVMNYASEHNIYPAEEHMYYNMDTVLVDNRISMEKLALALGTTTEEIREYNPSLKRGVIPFNTNGVILNLPYHYAVQVPGIINDTALNNKLDQDMIALNREIEKERPEKIVYKVKSGDYLAKIARKYDVSVVELKQWNRKTIRGGKVTKGQKIRIYTNRA